MLRPAGSTHARNMNNISTPSIWNLAASTSMCTCMWLSNLVASTSLFFDDLYVHLLGTYLWMMHWLVRAFAWYSSVNDALLRNQHWCSLGATVLHLQASNPLLGLPPVADSIASYLRQLEDWDPVASRAIIILCDGMTATCRAPTCFSNGLEYYWLIWRNLLVNVNI